MKRSVNMTIDIGGDLDHYLSVSHSKSKVIKIDRGITAGIQNGMIEDNEKLMSCISFFKDMTSLSDSGLNTLFGKATLHIISRGALSKFRKEMVRYCARQLLFDECIFTTHEELAQSNVLAGLKNAICLRIYKTEILIDVVSVAIPEKLRFDPHMMVYSLKRFLESKYSIALDDCEVEKLLLNHFQIEPKSVGKKVIRYKVFQADQKEISVSFHEVAEALRPISKSLVECLMPHIKKPNGIPVVTHFYTEIDWVRAFFECGIRMYMTMPHRFVDTTRGNEHLFLTLAKNTSCRSLPG